MTPGARKTITHRRRYTASTDGRQSNTARSRAPSEGEPRRIELELRVPAPPVGIPVSGPGDRRQRALERVPEPEELPRVIVEDRDTSPEGGVGEGAAVKEEQEQRRLAPQGPHGGILLSTPTETGVSRLGRLRVARFRDARFRDHTAAAAVPDPASRRPTSVLAGSTSQASQATTSHRIASWTGTSRRWTSRPSTVASVPSSFSPLAWRSWATWSADGSSGAPISSHFA